MSAGGLKTALNCITYEPECASEQFLYTRLYSIFCAPHALIVFQPVSLWCRLDYVCVSHQKYSLCSILSHCMSRCPFIRKFGIFFSSLFQDALPVPLVRRHKTQQGTCRQWQSDESSDALGTTSTGCFSWGSVITDVAFGHRVCWMLTSCSAAADWLREEGCG